MNPHVDTYLLEGCGRCEHYQTPQCKVHSWQEELIALRKIVLDTELKEEYKWSQPCYTLGDSNVLIVSAFKDYAFISFFKGTLLKDTHKMLLAPGKSSQAARQLRFTEVQDIFDQESQIKSYIQQAIEIEKKGLKVPFKKELEPMPDELLQKFEEDPDFEEAFKALTKGRQRGYILYFSAPKQSKTRTSRIEKYLPNIMKGEGLHDNYKSMKNK